ncbi:MAG TPA: Hsp20/alpha crystallin family protein [Planctomycetaceae bacterium]|nr:Hsp20/alpha crystallin family protein [Planctomycetaceae bacterium]HIQ21910.1 Hsp20/alpha crystallin family protein [Planctomycetota bacterium]
MADDSGVSKPVVEEASAEQTRAAACYRPHVDILETADELVVLADVPGAAADSIDVDFEQGRLTVHARVPARQKEGTEFWLQEYGVADFHRSLQIGEAIDAAGIRAEYADGVLAVHLPKAPSAKPRKIAVRAG